jgi:copper chaperone CopZ
MKRSFVMLMAGAFFIAGNAFAAGKQIKVEVNGMVCAMCSQGVKKIFGGKEAVEKVEVSLEKKEISLTLKEGKDLSDQEIASGIKDSGINVVKIVR